MQSHPLLPLLVLISSPAVAQDVPLELWTNATWPTGLPVGGTNGVSWGDYDADGWVDFFAARSGRLWHNLGGEDWEVFPGIIQTKGRYGSSWGDYDADGLPDIATEPRQSTGEPMKILHNLGGGPNFFDIVTDPNLVDVPPFGDAETNCWGDVDFDGDLDLFVPVYPADMGGPGNFFLQNLGPTGPNGEHRFTEQSAQAGLDNPPGSARPEGAQFCDVDGDGDIDLYSNGTLYVNRSANDAPLFQALTVQASGIKFSAIYDEGCAFFDHDLDGDLDLVIAFCGAQGVRIFENQGDGTFDVIPKDTVEFPNLGLCLGLSHADWDNDGDIDFTTRQVFRKNMLMETGVRGYLVASHGIPGDHLTAATPAWADWDRDGDLDCSLGNWTDLGHFYENVLYDGDTTHDGRRYVRVRPVRWDDGQPRGLEVEYGASVELFVAGDDPEIRRRKVVSSSGGYLNQDEYTLHFALPADPDPADPRHDLFFDVQVDFPSDPAQGLHRVDRWVNPALGRVALADLAAREILVYRDGRVTIDDCTYAPVDGNSTLLATTTGGLALTTNAVPLGDPMDAAAADTYVGLDFDTHLATGPLRLKEVLVDGKLDPAPAICGGEDVRLLLWDVTQKGAPILVRSRDEVRRKRNHRTAYRFDTLLRQGRRYRMVARVDAYRATAITAPVVDGGVTVNGGVRYVDVSPCAGIAAQKAWADPNRVYLAVRFADDSGALWADLGHALAGSSGAATLSGDGPATPGSTIELSLAGAPPDQATILVVGSRAICRPLGGGLLIPAPDALFAVATDGTGEWTWTRTLPGSLPPGTSFYFQIWWPDAGGPEGRAASNALSVTAPF